MDYFTKFYFNKHNYLCITYTCMYYKWITWNTYPKNFNYLKSIKLFWLNIPKLAIGDHLLVSLQQTVQKQLEEVASQIVKLTNEPLNMQGGSTTIIYIRELHLCIN